VSAVAGFDFEFFFFAVGVTLKCIAVGEVVAGT
jgi:hypothetical protein